jgi:hypothetical protein
MLSCAVNFWIESVCAPGILLRISFLKKRPRRTDSSPFRLPSISPVSIYFPTRTESCTDPSSLYPLSPLSLPKPYRKTGGGGRGRAFFSPLACPPKARRRRATSANSNHSRTLAQRDFCEGSTITASPNYSRTYGHLVRNPNYSRTYADPGGGVPTSRPEQYIPLSYSIKFGRRADILCRCDAFIRPRAPRDQLLAARRHSPQITVWAFPLPAADARPSTEERCRWHARRRWTGRDVRRNGRRT